ncbi:putative serine/threonine protein kinase [Diaporthe sp. PMI_573]|nr:putative serine/threonine protein kinase [Diaporthaceae sp. PMI_573]
MDSLSETRPPSPVKEFPRSGFEVVDDSDKLDEEKYEWYSVKTWYPVQIGEVFQDLYQVITKIGYGTASTSWLCRDLKNHRYVVLKVYCTDAEQDSRETAALEHIESILATPEGRLHAGQTFIRRLLDKFTVSNPKAEQPKPNVCLVYKPMGMSLSDMQTYSYDDDGMPVDVVKGITMYLLAGLDFLHSKANLVHTDLQHGNIMFSVESESSLDAVVEEELSDPSPRKIYEDGHIIFKSRDIITGDIQYPTICDFGEARFGKDEYEEHAMPDLYRAPEILLHTAWTKKIDIWALGLMIWNMVEGRNLFRDSQGGRWQSALPHMARMVSLFGRPPQHMLDQSAATDKFFEENGNLKEGHELDRTSLEEEETKLEGDEKREFLRFVGRMLQWDPKKRPSARELAADPWPQSGLDGDDSDDADMEQE